MAHPTDRLRLPLLEIIEKGQLQLPLLSPVAAELLQLCRSEDISIAKLSATLHRDQALASHVLRVANSPAYMGPVKIVSLQQAVTRLGLGQLSEIALTLSLKGKIFDVPGYEDVLRELWMHSIAASAYAKEVAKARRRNVELAFLCGLLHDIGRPVLLQAVSNLERRLKIPRAPDGHRGLIDDLHSRVGAKLAQAWKLPNEIMHCIRFHHHKDLSALSPADSEHVWTVAFADHLVHCLLENRGSVKDVPGHVSVTHLNLYPDVIENLISQKERIRKSAEALA